MRFYRSISRALRRAGLIGVADQVLAQRDRLRNHGMRRRFRHHRPDFVLPPPALGYDAYGPWEPESYLRQGSHHAAYVAALIRRHRPEVSTIAEWGCGPMRVLRHMPSHFPPPARLVGLDYNPRTISWCRANFAGIEFLQNDLAPPLPLATASVDVIYAISVFTHLSEPLHHAYVADLMRCLVPDGILIVSLHGDRYRDRLDAEEQLAYDLGKLVVRSRTIEGSRAFGAFHPPAFVRDRMFRDATILEHDTADHIEGFRQDHWVVRGQGS
jgi:SAM-dependent methyltransferase